VFAVECGKGCSVQLPIGDALAGLPQGQWTRLGVHLGCLRTAGADTARLDVPFALRTGAGAKIALARVATGTEFEHKVDCAVR
jgi:beta-glucosidase